MSLPIYEQVDYSLQLFSLPLNFIQGNAIFRWRFL